MILFYVLFIISTLYVCTYQNSCLELERLRHEVIKDTFERDKKIMGDVYAYRVMQDSLLDEILSPFEQEINDSIMKRFNFNGNSIRIRGNGVYVMECVDPEIIEDVVDYVVKLMEKMPEVSHCIKRRDLVEKYTGNVY